jgi:hypothetical protein
MGKGKGGGTGAAGANALERSSILGGQGRRVFNQAFPTFSELQGQQLEALRTGGVGAQIPIIQRAVEAAKSAGSEALQNTEASLGANNLAGSPFGQQILAQLRQGTQQIASNIPTEMASNFINQAGQTSLGGLQAAQGLGQAALGGLTGLAGSQAQLGAGQSGGKGTAAGGGAAAIGTIIAALI